MNTKKIFTILLISALSTLCLADVVYLVNGSSINGEIIAQKEDKLYIDLGYDLISVPLEKVQKIDRMKDITDPQQQKTPEITIEQDAEKDPNKLYYSFQQDLKSIEEAVDIVGQAVVKVSTPSGLGSGFFINEKGHLITNYHVVEKETRINVTMFKRTEDGFDKIVFKKIKIEAINPFVDLALLKVEDVNDAEIKYVPLGSIEPIRTGQQVFAIGNPLGLERTVTDGVISTTNRAFQGLVYIQTNADINPGNSGGPLFNLAGQVIGVTNMGYIFSGGLGFAIPIDYVKHFVDNREAFSFDENNPNTGFKYIQPASRKNFEKPDLSNK